MVDSTISRKTVTAKPKKENIVQSGKQNVLNNFRSYTYNFTLAGLRREAVNNPSVYRDKPLDLVILQSGGKGTSGFSTNVSAVTRKVGETVTQVDAGFDQGIVEVKKAIFETDTKLGKELVEGFNKKSSGRFDMFIDNIEVETLMTFTKEGGVTMPTSLRFKIIEPYSINGFIEALHVTAVASGYPSYLQASFLLRMNFIGYEDNDDSEFKEPKIIENATRYFPIKFTGVEVDINEKGTVYNCTAIPWNDQAFGQANKLKKPINMTGKTVSEICKNFAKSLNEQVKSNDNLLKSGTAINDSDEYEIVFPVRTESGFDYDKVNEIGQSKFLSLFRNNPSFKFGDPGKETKQTPQQKDSAPEEVKLHPGSGTPPQIQFAEGQQINEIIAAIIRDSEYIKTIIKQKKIDDNGFIDYFMIKSDVTNKGGIDGHSRKPYQKFRYSILPYKVHFTAIPPFKGQKYKPEAITKLSLREYNYIYTGNNLDVLNFKLNFNNLFFEAVPAALGNNDQPGNRDTAAQPNYVAPEYNPDDIENIKTDRAGTPTSLQNYLNVVEDGANAAHNPTDPYSTLAKNLHKVITDSKANLISGTIDILGDPFYLVTGGIGNYDPKPGTRLGQTSDGEADYLQGEVLIAINFKNPIDIKPLEEGGLFYFQTEKLPFSGVYRVTQVRSIFNEGVFKQELTIIRYPGQIIGKTKETVVTEKVTDLPKKEDIEVPSTTQGSNRGGVPASEVSILNFISRGLTSPGLPGILSNFTKAAGGLGGQLSGILSNVPGSVSRGLGSITGANSVFGLGNIDQIASGIRMKVSGLVDTVSSNLNNAAKVVQSGRSLIGSFGVSSPNETVVKDLTDNAKSALNRLSILGSGIGEGATANVNRVASFDTPSGLVKEGVANIDLLQTNFISNADFSYQINNLGTNAISNIASIGSKASEFVGSAKDKISVLTAGLPNDPAAVAAKFGFNPVQLSGLTGDLQSKVMDQFKSLGDKVPEDTNLSIATARGLSLTYVPAEKLSNIPATSPYLTAPSPEPDFEFLNSLAKQGDNAAIAAAFGVNDISKISGSLLPTGQLNSVLSNARSVIANPLSAISNSLVTPDSNLLSDKLAGAKSMIGDLSSYKSSLENNLLTLKNQIPNGNLGLENLTNSVGVKFGNLSQLTSPLDRLIKKG